MNPTDPELLVALEVLRESITHLDQSILNNARRTQGDAAKTSGGKGVADITSVINKLTASLLPIAAIGGVLQGFGPGLQLVSTAMKLLGTAILPVVMPLFVLFAVGLTMIADAIWENLEPGLETFYDLIFSTVIPAMTALADGVMWASKKLREGGEAMGDWIAKQLYGDEMNGTKNADWDEGKQQSIADANASKARDEALKAGRTKDEAEEAAKFAKFGGAKPKWMQDLEAGVPSAAVEPAAETPAEAAAEPSSGKNRIGKAFKDVFGELRHSMGPSAQFSGITDVNKNAQLAALNASPFESKMLDMTTKMVDAMERTANNTLQKEGGRY